MFCFRVSRSFLAFISLFVSIGVAHAKADVESRVATIFSEGTRIHADVYHLKALAGKSLPTIIMALGYLALTPQTGRGDQTPSPAQRERVGVRAGRRVQPRFDILAKA